MALESLRLDEAGADRALALVDPALRAASVTRLEDGESGAVFEVASRDGRRFLVKLYGRALAWKPAKETVVLALVAGRKLAAPVPQILAADDAAPAATLVMTKLEGERVSTLLDREAEDDLEHVNRQVGAFLRSLHEVAPEAFGYIGPRGIAQPFTTNVDFMRGLIQRNLRTFAELGGDPTLHAAVERHVDDRAALLAGCTVPALCHNDCHYANVLVVADGDRMRVSGVLDFENALAGDPLLDLAKTYCYAPVRSERLLAALVDGYGAVRADWREALDLYVLHHMLELWAWYASIGRTEALDGLAQAMRLVM